MLTTGVARARYEAIQPLVPDPCSAVLNELDRAAPLRLVKHRQSQSQIFGSARQLVAEAGLDNVHMQDVADRSGVAVQTVYNLVGGRATLIGAAATEWMVCIARNAERVAAAHDVNIIFAMIEAFWASSIDKAQYARNLVNSKSSPVIHEQPLIEGATAVIAGELSRLRDDDLLVEWVNIPATARHMATTCHAHVRNWLNAPYSVETYREALVNCSGLLLRGAVCGSEVERVERGLRGGWAAEAVVG